MATTQTENHNHDVMMHAIKMRGDMPIPGLLRVLERNGMAVEGGWGVYLPERPNTVLWTGMSEDAAHAIGTFLGRDDVNPQPLNGFATVMVFGWEGLPVLDLPSAEDIDPANDFSALHWLPLTIKDVRPGSRERHAQTRMVKRVAFTRDDRILAWNKSQGHCWYCGQVMNPFDDFTIDHVHPVADGCTNAPDNLVPCCATCNSEKRAMPLERFRQRRGGGLFWYEIARGRS